MGKHIGNFSGIKLKKKLKNKFEIKINRQLKRSKLIYKYESERIPYVLARHYIPDFIVQTITGYLYIECKGHLRREDKAKLVAVKRQHPEKDIRIVFYKRTVQSVRWAEKNGFKYAIDKIPSEWLRGL